MLWEKQKKYEGIKMERKDVKPKGLFLIWHFPIHFLTRNGCQKKIINSLMWWLYFNQFWSVGRKNDDRNLIRKNNINDIFRGFVFQDSYLGTKIGTGRAIPGLEFMPGWMRTPLLHRLLGSDSFLKQRHSFGWVHAFASWLGHFQ